jgi:hypothetical protein
MATVLLLALCFSCDASGPTLNVVAYKNEIVADDGFVLNAFDFHLEEHERDEWNGPEKVDGVFV